jgi:hypothetical protein
MGKFNASLRLPGETETLDAIVRVDDGRIHVASGEYVIGDWDIHKVDLSRVPEGFRLTAEGEELLLDIPDRSTFEEETSAKNGKRKGPRAKKASTVALKPSRADKKTAKTGKSTQSEPSTPRSSGELSALDRFLASAEERFGSKLPKWFFTRGGLVVVLAALVLVIFFSGFVSTLLLITGVIGVLIGGVTMLDSVIARQVLRHKITPIRVVIAGGTVFVAGLLLGFIA